MIPPTSDALERLRTIWGDLQCHGVYYANEHHQAELVHRIRAAISSGHPTEALRSLEGSESLTAGVASILDFAGTPGGTEALTDLLEELVAEISRETDRRGPVAPMPDLEARIRFTLSQLEFADPTDLIEVVVEPGKCVWVNYISRRMSPRYDGLKGPWDRDTQYMFEMWFTTGLFIWLSAHTVPEFQGRGFGTLFFRAFETLARDMGFRRFSVLGPNNGPYWQDVMGYTVRSTKFFNCLESYKELAATP